MTEYILNPPKPSGLELQSITLQKANQHDRNLDFANKITQTPQLNWFVPTIQKEDGSWEVLEEPNPNNPKYDTYYERDICELNQALFDEDCYKYQTARKNVLFDLKNIKSIEHYDSNIQITIDLNGSVSIIVINATNTIEQINNIHKLPLTESGEIHFNLK